MGGCHNVQSPSVGGQDRDRAPARKQLRPARVRGTQRLLCPTCPPPNPRPWQALHPPVQCCLSQVSWQPACPRCWDRTPALTALVTAPRARSCGRRRQLNSLAQTWGACQIGWGPPPTPPSLNSGPGEQSCWCPPGPGLSLRSPSCSPPALTLHRIAATLRQLNCPDE